MPKEEKKTVEIRIRGKDTEVSSKEICGRRIISTGHLLKTAAVMDEAFVEGEIVPDLATMLPALREWEEKPDLFVFGQKITNDRRLDGVFSVPDNYAVIPITTYDDWLKKRAKRDVRENIRRANREGVKIESVEYDQKFVSDLKGLYDETPVRQGMPCWHHGKSFDNIWKVHATYKERAEYLAAYVESEFIGFIKMVYTDNVAKTMHVISKEKYFRKRPINALIAKAVEVCCEKGIEFFIYGAYRFPGKSKSTLADFKRRNGFEEYIYPRYHVPLTTKGRLALATGLHRDPRYLIPAPLKTVLLRLRSKVYGKRKSISS